MIIEELKAILPVGSSIPKPLGSDCQVSNWKVDNQGNTKMVYSFPLNKAPKARNKKTITEIEITKSFDKLMSSGELRTAWYKETFPQKSYNSPCNFTTIGGMFVKLGLANYKKRGLYLKV